MTAPAWGEAPTVLVACCSSKLSRPAPAAELYTSDLFRKSRAWAERFGGEWFILSAKHGVLEPHRVIEPYDETLEGKTPLELELWSMWVAGRFIAPRRHIVILAGRLYRRWAIAREGFHVPMSGLGIGQQKAWLKEQLAHAGERSSPPA